MMNQSPKPPSLSALHVIQSKYVGGTWTQKPEVMDWLVMVRESQVAVAVTRNEATVFKESTACAENFCMDGLMDGGGGHSKSYEK